MSFQSPPFWCLMTTQHEFANMRETPPRSVHDLCICLWNATYTPYLVLPLTFTSPKAFASYEYKQDISNASMVWGT